jgi:hypothetical protein
VKARSRPKSKKGTEKREGRNKKALQRIVAELFVPGAGLEPARTSLPTGF